MPPITPTESAVFIPEVWSKECLLAREEALLFANRVLRKDSEVSKWGDIIHIPEVANLTANIVGAGGTIAPQAPTETEKTLTVNQWYEASVDIEDRVDAMSMYNLFDIYGGKIGFALGDNLEVFTINLENSAGVQNGTEGATLSTPILADAVALLDIVNAPLRDRYMYIKPSQKSALLQIQSFTYADAIPYVKGNSPLLTGQFGDIFGVEVLVGNRVPFRDYDADATSEYINLLWQKEAFCMAVQIEPNTEKLARTKLSTTMVGSQMYGGTACRPNHCVRLPTTT